MLLVYYYGVASYIWGLKSQNLTLSLFTLAGFMLLCGGSFLILSMLFLKQGRDFYTRALKPRLGRFLK
jgi:hypothetical protein